MTGNVLLLEFLLNLLDLNLVCKSKQIFFFLVESKCQNHTGGCSSGCQFSQEGHFWFKVRRSQGFSSIRYLFISSKPSVTAQDMSQLSLE